MGAHLGATPAEVFTLTLAQAALAEDLDYDELWVTEHHFCLLYTSDAADE